MKNALARRSSSCHCIAMRQKELRLALVCYGGISLAVYMHGVTKELWHAQAREPGLVGKRRVHRRHRVRL